MKNRNFNKNRQPAHQITGSSVEVRNDDVNGALRRLRKILERDNRQKELSKREYHEKASIKKKRAKAQAAKRHAKSISNQIDNGSYIPYKQTGTKYLKSKRTKRKAWMLEEKLSKRKR